MSVNKPIYLIAKDMDMDSNRIILACKNLGINAKASSKRLNNEELEKIKNYFNTGKNAANETIEISNKATNNNTNKTISKSSKKEKINSSQKNLKVLYFPNRLIDL